MTKQDSPASSECICDSKERSAVRGKWETLDNFSVRYQTVINKTAW
jgi:hypothetical protein